MNYRLFVRLKLFTFIILFFQFGVLGGFNVFARVKFSLCLNLDKGFFEKVSVFQ